MDKSGLTTMLLSNERPLSAAGQSSRKEDATALYVVFAHGQGRKEPEHTKAGRVAKRLLAGLLLFAPSVIALGCRSHVASADQEFQELFAGYQLILVSDLQPGRPVEQVDISKLQGFLPLKPQLVSGRVYVFRKITQVPNETMALKVFPERLG